MIDLYIVFLYLIPSVLIFSIVYYVLAKLPIPADKKGENYKILLILIFLVIVYVLYRFMDPWAIMKFLLGTGLVR